MKLSDSASEHIMKKINDEGFLGDDETTFFHPEFIDTLINELPEIEYIGACRVVLPKCLQKYLLGQWRNCINQLFLLIFKQFYTNQRFTASTFKNNFKSSVAMALVENGIPSITILTINKSVIDYI